VRRRGSSLCTGGLVQVVTAKNTKQARIGDMVKIGLIRGIKIKGYVLAYVIPPTALVLGTVAGHFLGALAGFPRSKSLEASPH
jgi:positive regulator of sigma E activity